MSKTQLKKLVIEKFRALNNVEVEFGDYITVVCGKNGTSKSSILGIAAQIFSFEKDYAKDEVLSFRQIAGGAFKSQYSEHFRISDTFDVPGSMTVNIELHDGYTNQPATAKLELMKRQSERGNTLPRPVVRNNSTATATGSSNKSRNFTHPVIFLSLKRLYPIAARDYKVVEHDAYLKKHKQAFIGLTTELLNRSSAHVTGTGGTIRSAVAHGANYDQESVSAGEDNAGQIILALMSFRKLKEEYPDYKGGLLLIDEADAGLFPTAQVNLLRMLERECKSLNLQAIMTSHSPTLIEYAFEQSQDQQKKYKYKTVYLSDSRGKVQVMHDLSWSKIYADINSKPPIISSATLPKINVYFEDHEAEEFFNALMIGQPLKKIIKTMSGVTLGCDSFKHLIDHKVPEFSEKSVICLDADAAQKLKRKYYKTIVLLPGTLPPDQLIFEHLYNLPADDPFWTDDFDRSVFTNCTGTANAIREMQISGEKIDLKKKVAAYTKSNQKARDIFKGFYKDQTLQQLFALKPKQHNPWKHWVNNNPEPVNAFLEKFKSAIQCVMKDGYAVDPAKLAALEVKLKKV